MYNIYKIAYQHNLSRQYFLNQVYRIVYFCTLWWEQNNPFGAIKLIQLAGFYVWAWI